jgi:hypothetical protein
MVPPNDPDPPLFGSAADRLAAIVNNWTNATPEEDIASDVRM